MSEEIWRGMTREELDAAYNNTAAVKHSAATLADWTRRSADLRAAHPELLNLSYGPRPRNKIDLFRCGKSGAPLFVFIHGGYWQRNSKEIFSCMAEGPLAHGFDAAIIGYTLAPEATLTEIVAETHAAIRWLRSQGPRHGVGNAALVVSGWSAGGHLAAMAMSLEEVDAGFPISGIFDIEPCRLNYLNEKLRLSEKEVETLSPIYHLPRESKPMIIAFGASELPELQRQSRDYAKARGEAGLPTRLLALATHDHFSILEELYKPGGKLTAALFRLLHA
ncbi:MAG: alpha/beta hydrolase [Pseudorhodoplanes sp.]|jgi:acetyl esterase/lipase|nr:alpha/beta hydrolase [Pseudorhodoplanes sp.]